MTSGPQEPKQPALPEQTGDGTDPEGGDWREDDREDDQDRDRWLERERPPHWE